MKTLSRLLSCLAPQKTAPTGEAAHRAAANAMRAAARAQNLDLAGFAYNLHVDLAEAFPSCQVRFAFSKGELRARRLSDRAVGVFIKAAHTPARLSFRLDAHGGIHDVLFPSHPDDRTQDAMNAAARDGLSLLVSAVHERNNGKAKPAQAFVQPRRAPVAR